MFPESLRSILWLRHADAVPPSKELPPIRGRAHLLDCIRGLTEKGQAETGALYKRLANQVGDFDLVLSSPAWRCRQTVMGALDIRDEEVVVVSDCLMYGDPEDGSEESEALAAMFKQLSYAPLNEYLKHPKKDHLVSHCRVACSYISQMVRERRAESIAICGHAPLITTQGVVAAGDDASVGLELMDYSPGTCQGFRMYFYNGSCSGVMFI